MILQYLDYWSVYLIHLGIDLKTIIYIAEKQKIFYYHC